jgi:uncharacterized membrane protein
MHTDNGDELEPTIFSATLTPHRSLGRVGFLILMVLFGLVSFITGMLFLVLGAWPVFGSDSTCCSCTGHSGSIIAMRKLTSR